VIALAIAARSCVSCRRGTLTDVAPARSASGGYASNFAAWVADGFHELLEDPHRAAADGDVPGWHAEPLSDCAGQRLGTVVRVAVDGAACLRDYLYDRRQRPVRRLIGGQLVRFAAGDDRRLARLVRGNGVKHGAEPG
jgi:hypothetical protein